MSKEKGQGKLNSLLSAGMDDIKETGSPAGDTQKEKTESQVQNNESEPAPKVTQVAQEKKEVKPAAEYRTRENEEIITSSAPTEYASVDNFDEFRQRFCGPHPGRKEQKKQPINITANNHEWLVSLGTGEKANIEDIINNVLADFRQRNDKYIKKSLKLYSDKIMGKS